VRRDPGQTRYAGALLLALILPFARLGAQAGQPPASGAAAPSGGAASTPAGDAAAEAPPSADPPSGAASSAEDEADLVRKTLALDISTASFYELVAWCRSRGLPSGGSIAELKARLYESYGVEPPAAAGAAGRTVTIERAAEAEYFELEEEGSSLVRLSGGVVLVVREEGKAESHRLEADEILYDRDRNSVSAKGRVRYRREGSAGVEEFFGETIVVDLDDWSGVFLDGRLRRTEAGAAEGERGLSFSSETMLKRSGDVIILERGTVSSCDEESPHYSVRARKMWLLGENEWAVSDAVLSVGEVPILWLPFFYYPGDEIVFHPVFGYRSREGRFVQTTTYLIGRKVEKKEASGFFKMAKASSGGPVETRGIFLHPVKDAEAAAKDAASGPTLKLLADLYSGLGAFVGLDGKLAAKAPLEKLEFTAGVGLSRSLFPVTNGYSPYVQEGDWRSVMNGSELFGASLPFRYGLDLSASLRSGGLSASLGLPVYSDPFFERDFRYRSEDMEWLDFGGLADSASSTSTSASSSQPSKRSSLLQRLDLSYSWRPAALSPWLSQFDLSRLGLSLTWLAKAATDDGSILYDADPAREFFYPDVFRPVDASLTLRGSLLPAKGKEAAGAAASVAAQGEGLREPWEEASGGAAGEGEAAGGEGEGEGPAGTADASGGPAGGAAGEGGAESGAAAAAPKNEATGSGLRQAGRLPDAPRAASRDPFSLSADWSLTPSAFIEDRYLGGEWQESGDIDFSRLYRLSSYRLGATLGATARAFGDLATASLGLSFNSQDQSRVSTDDPDYASRVASYRLADAQYRQAKLGSSLKLSAKPFADSWLFGSSSLSYSLDAKLYELAYKGMDGDTALYSERFPEWSSDGVTSHAAAFTLGLRTGSKTQSLGVAMSLPPTTEAYSALLSLEAGEGGLGATLGVKARMYRPTGAADYSYDPVSATLGLTGSGGLKLGDSLSYDAVLGKPLTNSASLGLGGFTATLQHKQSPGYTPVLGSGWVSDGDTAFRATDFTAALKGDLKSPEDSKLGLGLSLSGSYTQNLLRFSESVLSLGLTASLKIDRFLDLSFTSLSQNAAVWRYWPGLFPAVDALGGAEAWYKNPLLDLYESVSFWDPEARRRSLFKLKSLSLKLKHDLHDWDLSFELSATPKLDTSSTPYVYVLDTSFSILVAWRDVPEIKTKVTKDDSGLAY